MIDQDLIDRLAKMVGISERLCDGSPSERWTAVGIDDMNEVLAALTAAKAYADAEEAVGLATTAAERKRALRRAVAKYEALLAHFGGAQ